MKAKISIYCMKTVLSILLLSAGITLAGSNFNSVSGAKSLSLNGMYYAGVEGSAALFSNPAGMVFTPSNSIDFLLVDRIEEQEFTHENGTFYNSFNDDVLDIGLSFIYKISEESVIGIGYNKPLHYNVDWPNVVLLRNNENNVILAFDHYNKITLESGRIAFSQKYGSINLGISANVFRLKNNFAFYQGNPVWNQNIGLAAYQVKYEQDAYSFGFNLGFTWDYSDDLRIGGFIESSTSFDLEGTAESNYILDIDSGKTSTDLSSTFETPWSVGVGAVYNLSPVLILNCDLSYKMWGGTQENIEYKYEDADWTNRFSDTDSISGYNPSNIILDYNNSFELGLGLEYYNPAGVSFRFGYKYTTTPNTDITYSRLFPNTDQHWFSLGLGFTYENIDINGAVVYLMGVETEVASASMPNFNGKYMTSGYYPTINIRYNL